VLELAAGASHRSPAARPLLIAGAALLAGDQRAAITADPTWCSSSVHEPGFHHAAWSHAATVAVLSSG
jgi:hypothetical protein